VTQGYFSGRGFHHALWFFTIDLPIHRDLNQLRIDFHMIQPVQCSGQVLRQKIAPLRGQAVVRLCPLEQPKARPASRSVDPKIGAGDANVGKATGGSRAAPPVDPTPKLADFSMSKKTWALTVF
jgi:hypothetical protein